MQVHVLDVCSVLIYFVNGPLDVIRLFFPFNSAHILAFTFLLSTQFCSLSCKAQIAH